jgi:hypothetical protein
MAVDENIPVDNRHEVEFRLSSAYTLIALKALLTGAIEAEHPLVELTRNVRCHAGYPYEWAVDLPQVKDGRFIIEVWRNDNGQYQINGSIYKGDSCIGHDHTMKLTERGDIEIEILARVSDIDSDDELHWFNILFIVDPVEGAEKIEVRKNDLDTFAATADAAAELSEPHRLMAYWEGVRDAALFFADPIANTGFLKALGIAKPTLGTLRTAMGENITFGAEEPTTK